MEIWVHVLSPILMREYGIVLSLLGGSSISGWSMESFIGPSWDSVEIGLNGMGLCDTASITECMRSDLLSIEIVTPAILEALLL